MTTAAKAPAQHVGDQHFPVALNAMELAMNYESYVPVDGRVRRQESGGSFFEDTISAALQDTFTALNCIGQAKEHLNKILVFNSSSKREIKSRYAKAQESMREAMRYSQVLCLRGALVNTVRTPLHFGMGRKARDRAKGSAKEFGILIVEADELVRKIVTAIGRDLARAGE